MRPSCGRIGGIPPEIGLDDGRRPARDAFVNNEQWARVKTLFLAALSVRPESRHDWLGRYAGDDPDVLREVDALVRAHETADGFLKKPSAPDSQDVIPTTARTTAASALPDDALGPGVRVNEYEIRREIGRGGMGVVYLAQDVNLGRPAAIKALPAIAARDQTLLERLRREARAAAAVSHPGVAMVYAFLETPQGNFIASEYVHGQTLRQELARGPVEPTRAIRIATEIAHALCAAHDAHIVHRDLKPENVLLTASGSIKVIDFGIARIDTLDPQTSTYLVQGTPGYMAPEQAVPGATVDHRADVYALGIIFSEMLLGHHPFQRGPGDAPAPLQSIARHCFESDPERRYQSIRDFLHDLQNVSRTLTPGDADTRQLPGTSSGGTMWWWQFHQCATAVIYWLVTIPAWYARELIGGATGRTLFFCALGALILASILRLHLWFTSRMHPPELLAQYGHERPWILCADAVFAIALIVSGVMVGEARMSLAMLLLGIGIGAAVVSVFIEPATARAALSVPKP
jgi:predicted Ser/Thr protein kinase